MAFPERRTVDILLRLYCTVRCRRCVSRQALDQVSLFDSSDESALWNLF